MANTRDKDLPRIYSYGLDEAARADSVANGTRQINPMDAHGQFRNALAPRGGVAFDGTSNARVSSTLIGQTIGADAHAEVIIFKCPTAAPSVVVGLYCVADSNSGVSGTNGLSALFDSGATYLKISTRNNVAGGGGRNRYLTNFIGLYFGKVVCLVLVRSGGTLNVYVNGVLTAAYTEDSYGTNPSADWSDSITGSPLYFNVGFISSSQVAAFPIYCASLYNLALSAADVQEIYELGGAVPERYKFGSTADRVQTARSYSNGTADANNTAGSFADGVTAANVAGARTGGAGANYLSLIEGSASGGRGGGINIGWALGKIYRVRWWEMAADASNMFIASWGFRGNSNLCSTQIAGTSVLNYALTQAWVSQDATFQITSAPGGTQCFVAYMGAGGTAGSSGILVDDMQIQQLGAVVHLRLDDGFGYELLDASTNKLHAVMTPTGVTHVLPVNRPKHICGTTSTNGNQQAFGQVLIPANSQILNINMRSETGAPTVTMGTASGGAQLVASSALTTSWAAKTLALAGGIVAVDTSIWIGSNSTDVVDFDILCMPLSP